MNNITSDPTTTPCAVNRRYYPHMFLIPAVIIITILAFLRRRSSFKKQVWGGRPGLVIPIDFLGIDHDRLAIVFVFGAATGSIVDLILTKYEGRNIWETAFIGIGIALEVAFLYYPYFACLASYHRIIGALMGLPYASIMFALGKTMDLEECNGNTRTWQDVVFMYILPNILTIICHLCILGKFIIVLYQEIKEYGIFGIQIFDRRNEDLSMQVNLTRPWLINHVKDLIKRRTPQYSRTEYYLRKIYNPEKNFKFSTQTLSVVMICSILCYKISFILVLQASTLLDAINDDDSDHILVKLSRGFFGALLAGTILTAIFCVVSIIRFMENHKNNMLQMFKGDKSFIPRKINVTQFMIGKGLRYHSYQIGYFLWGYALLLSLFFLICFALFSLSLPVVQDYIVKFLKGGGVVAGVAVFTGLTLPMAAMTIFRDYDYQKDVISINNRNVYLLFSYFWFFVGLPMGFFSAISRILKAMAVGALMLPRIDKSVMPDGFQQIDQGFIAYVCYLHVQTAFRNPILRVFCQILCDRTQKNEGRKWVFSPQARARWFLGVTLARNPKLALERKSDIKTDTSVLCDFGYKHVDVNIEINDFDNAGLIQDDKRKN